MIDLYTGTPGSGKSLHTAERIKLYMHLYKSPVIANFEIRTKACKPRGNGSFFYINNQQLNPEFLFRFSEKYKEYKKVRRLDEEEILLVIDECQLLFNSRNWAGKDRMSWIGFFSQHRKLGYHVILIAQYDEMIDKQIRALIEYEHKHRKIKNVGIYGRIINMLAFGQLHICNVYHVPTGMQVEHYFFKGNEKLYMLYDSYTHFDEKAYSSEMRSVSDE